MDDAVSGSIGYAVGIAASPIPIVAAIVMVFSERPRVNSAVFTGTWVLGIAAVTAAGALIPGLGTDSGSRGTGRGWLRIGIGVVFLLLAVRNFRRRPKAGEEPSPPPWLTPERGVGLKAAVVLGVALSILNPKDVALSVSGGAAIGGEDLSTGRTLLAIIVFTVIAVSTVMLPVLAYLVMGARSADTFERVKNWLLRHNAIVLAVIWLVLGISFLLEGVSALD